MKDYRIVLAAIAATTVCLGFPWSAAHAQTASTADAGAAQVPALSSGAGEVVKLFQGGVGKEVILSYINNTLLSYHLSADGIVYLQTLGVPQEITKAMLDRDGQLQDQPISAAAAAPDMAVAAQPLGQVVVPTTPAPSVSVIGGSDYPAYDYGYPYYDYSDSYGWPLVIGGGWGWGYGGSGAFRGGIGDFHGGGGVGGFHGGGGNGGFRGNGGGGFRGGGSGGSRGGGGNGGFHGNGGGGSRGGGGGGFHGGGSSGGGHGGGGGHR